MIPASVGSNPATSAKKTVDFFIDSLFKFNYVYYYMALMKKHLVIFFLLYNMGLVYSNDDLLVISNYPKIICLIIGRVIRDKVY